MKRENAGKRSLNIILSFLRRALLIQRRSTFWMIIVFLLIRVLRVLIATSLSVPIISVKFDHLHAEGRCGVVNI